MALTSNKHIEIADAVRHWSDKIQAHHDAAGNVYGHLALLDYKINKKYIRVFEARGSVYCFIDFDGNILKADSWKSPAKGIRGNVGDPDHSWGKGVGVYGASYNR